MQDTESTERTLRSRRSLAAGRIKFGLVADQHLDSTITPELRITASAGLDPGGRHARLDQSTANHPDAIRVGPVQPDPQRAILIHVVRDITRLVSIGTLDLVAVGVERVVPLRFPAAVGSHRTLRTGRADRALRTRCAGRAGGTGAAGQFGVALSAHRSGRARCARGAGRAVSASRADIPLRRRLRDGLSSP